MTCNRQQFYTATVGYQGDTSAANVIILSVTLPFQIGFAVLFLFLMCRSPKPSKQEAYGKARKSEQVQVKGKEDYHRQIGKGRESEDNNNKMTDIPEFQNIGFLSRVEQTVHRYSTKTKMKVALFILMLCVLVSFVFSMLAVVASEQALSEYFVNAECILNETVKSFVEGDEEWIGVSQMVPNLTKLSLDLNTRVKTTQNAILGLLLNGTVAAFPIGFPLGKNIFDTISGTTKVSTGVESFIDASLRQWLFRNSSLSAGYQFPLCQTSTLSNIPHPIDDGETIQLDYMDSICANLTNEVNNLVANGRAVDDLLSLAHTVESTRPSVNANLSSYNSTLSEIGIRSDEYSTEFTSSSLDVSFPRALPIVIFALLCSYLLLLLVCLCCQLLKVRSNSLPASDKNQVVNAEDYMNKDTAMRINPESAKRAAQGMLDNISVSDESEISPSEAEIKKQAKLRKMLRKGILIDRKLTAALLLYGCFLNLLLILTPLLYTTFINTGIQHCRNFESALSGETSLSSLSLSENQVELLTPIQECTSGANTYFLETPDIETFRDNLQNLYEISELYNASTPINVFVSESLNQIQILKDYLLHMETMPIKASDFNIFTVLSQLNEYTNGSNTNSKQIEECSRSVVKDQYVYNSVDCSFTLINYETEFLTTEPRCLQVPTYNGSAGTNQTNLNNAQHTITLNSTCTSVFEFYDVAQSGCFLGKRSELLTNAGCTSTLAQYNRRLTNLVHFSIEAASYTNSYLQNLRNFFGVYAIMSTNLTDFFNGKNMSETLNQFGILSHNLLNQTQCSSVSAKTSQIYSSYCASTNSILMLLFDAYLWIYLACLFFLLSLLFFYLSDALMRVEYVEKNEQMGEIKKYFYAIDLSHRNYSSGKKRNKMEREEINQQGNNRRLELSEQTLKNEEGEEMNQERVIMVERNENIFKYENSDEDEGEIHERMPKTYREESRQTVARGDEKKVKKEKQPQLEMVSRKQDAFEAQDYSMPNPRNDAINKERNKQQVQRNTYSQQDINEKRLKYPKFFEDSSVEGQRQSDGSVRAHPSHFILNKEGGRFSKQEMRSRVHDSEQIHSRPPKQPKQVAIMSKQGQQNQRLKVIDMERIVHDNIDLMELHRNEENVSVQTKQKE